MIDAAMESLKEVEYTGTSIREIAGAGRLQIGVAPMLICKVEQ